MWASEVTHHPNLDHLTALAAALRIPDPFSVLPVDLNNFIIGAIVICDDEHLE